MYNMIVKDIANIDIEINRLKGLILKSKEDLQRKDFTLNVTELHSSDHNLPSNGNMKRINELQHTPPLNLNSPDMRRLFDKMTSGPTLCTKSSTMISKISHLHQNKTNHTLNIVNIDNFDQVSIERNFPRYLFE